MRHLNPGESRASLAEGTARTDVVSGISGVGGEQRQGVRNENARFLTLCLT